LSKIKISLFIITFLFLSAVPSFSGPGSGFFINISQSDTDTSEDSLYAFFDLRNRESFIQLTNVMAEDVVVHVQIFNVDDNCNENNFFDSFTPNDTHVYNMRDILTNNGNPSGVELPENAYGIVAILAINLNNGGVDFSADLIGNIRVLDDSGYEYRTNIAGRDTLARIEGPPNLFFPNYTFNFNKELGITSSDIIGITLNDSVANCPKGNVCAADPISAFIAFDVDILNKNENVFSCRNVIFACIDEDNPRQEELLENAEVASVARFEYGINNAIPHSKGGELLCPGNNIDEGFVTLQTAKQPTSMQPRTFLYFVGYVGLNNGNGRGSMDSFWYNNRKTQN